MKTTITQFLALLIIMTICGPVQAQLSDNPVNVDFYSLGYPLKLSKYGECVYASKYDNLYYPHQDFMVIDKNLQVKFEKRIQLADLAHDLGIDTSLCNNYTFYDAYLGTSTAATITDLTFDSDPDLEILGNLRANYKDGGYSNYVFILDENLNVERSFKGRSFPRLIPIGDKLYLSMQAGMKADYYECFGKVPESVPQLVDLSTPVIQVFPNPSQNTIGINWLKDNEHVSNIVLTAADGAEVKSVEANFSGTQYIDATDVAEGVYLLLLKDAAGRTLLQQKVMLQK